MAGIKIEALGRKLRLLIDLCGYGTWDSLGQEFNRSGKTLEYWEQGDRGRARDTLPGNRLDMLLNVVANVLPVETSSEEIRHLVFGPLDAFESAVRRQVGHLFSQLVEKHGHSPEVRMVTPKGARQLVQVDKKNRERQRLKVVLHETFRLEFTPAMEDGSVFAIQQAGQDWGSVTAEFDREKSMIYLPSRQDPDQPEFMYETHLTGLHKFIVVQLPVTPPSSFLTRQEESLSLDQACLNDLARAFEEQQASERSIYVIDIWVDGHEQ